MSKQVRGSWEKHPKAGGNRVHSPEGIAHMREALRWGLLRRYAGIAESMWVYDFSDPKFEDMNRMSRYTVPEKYLFRNGQAVFFELNGQIHCLPFSMYQMVNLYGYEDKVRAIPTNYVVGGDNPKAYEDIYNTILDDTNSVIIRNDLFGASDYDLIDTMVGQLCDSAATLSQLQLLAKSPFVYRVNQDNLLTAKNMFLAIAEDSAAIFVDSDTMPMESIVEQTNVSIDPGLLDLWSHWETIILAQLGIDCTDVHKRAQVSVAETEMYSDGSIAMRRQEKFNQRKKAIERLNELFGTNAAVTCAIDSQNDNEDRAEEQNESDEE